MPLCRGAGWYVENQWLESTVLFKDLKRTSALNNTGGQADDVFNLHCLTAVVCLGFPDGDGAILEEVTEHAAPDASARALEAAHDAAEGRNGLLELGVERENLPVVRHPRGREGPFARIHHPRRRTVGVQQAPS